MATKNTPFQIQEVSEADVSELIRCMWYTYEHPLQNLFHIVAPVNATGCNSREEFIKESADGLWEWHVSDPASHWIKVVNTDDGQIVGGALWKLNRSNPYENPQDEEAYWQPPGGQREFANQVLEKHEAIRAIWATRAHVYLNIILVHPDYQRRGIGSQILQWGVSKAAEMNVEMWLNAWKHGRPLYEKFGFVTVEHHITKPETADPDAAFKKCQKDWADLEEWVMWRPKHGPYREERSVKPWGRLSSEGELKTLRSTSTGECNQQGVS